jgi:DNA repair exonuclease SbcCD nuclease subunit/CheY-like chemotaxis protein
LLWAEDEDSAFASLVRVVEPFLKEHGISATIDRARDGNEVFRLLSSREYELVVLDLAMPNYNGIETIRDVAGRWPAVRKLVVSHHIDDPSYQAPIEKLHSEGCIVGAFDKTNQAGWQNAILKQLRFVPLTALHLSDVHFGKFHAFREVSALRDHVTAALGLIERSAARPNAVLVSGDLTSESSDSDFTSALEFMRFLQDKLRLPIDRFVVVPGNHDIDRARKSPRRFERYVEFLNDLAGGGIEGGVEFLRRYPKLYEGDGLLRRAIHTADDLFCICPFNEHRVMFMGLNSVVAADDRLDRGEITQHQLHQVREEIEKVDSTTRHFPRIVVFHHHLFPVPSICANMDDRILLNQGLVLAELMKMKTTLVVHGHSHYPSGYLYRPYFMDGIEQPLHVVSTGTLGGSHVHPAKSSFNLALVQFSADMVTERYTGFSVTPYTLKLDSLTWDMGRSEDIPIAKPGA